MRIELSAVLALALIASACGEGPTAVEPLAEADLSAGSHGPSVRGRFIVTLAERINPSAVAREHGVQPDFVYTHALNGFAGAISDAAREGLLRDHRVVRVEPDGIATVVTTEANATWGLDRIDQQRLPLSTTYTYSRKGTGVRVYVIDTGIRLSHQEFGGRAVSGYDAIDGGSADDCNGHGTHVAGTVGGSVYGVAKGVSLVGVRVLDCGGSGSWSGVIAGIDWVAANRVTPAVANLSLGGGANTSVDAAVKNLIAAGVATAVAAGNGNSAGIAQNACNYSPARVSAAMTIGATTKADRKASWSNYGSCVDWFAPGANITSSWHTSDGAIGTISGTSMATPHTAGVTALYLEGNRTATPRQVRDALMAKTIKGVVTYSRTTNNHMLFTNF